MVQTANQIDCGHQHQGEWKDDVEAQKKYGGDQFITMADWLVCASSTPGSWVLNTWKPCAIALSLVPVGEGWT